MGLPGNRVPLSRSDACSIAAGLLRSAATNRIFLGAARSTSTAGICRCRLRLSIASPAIWWNCLTSGNSESSTQPYHILFGSDPTYVFRPAARFRLPLRPQRRLPEHLAFEDQRRITNDRLNAHRIGKRDHCRVDKHIIGHRDVPLTAVWEVGRVGGYVDCSLDDATRVRRHQIDCWATARVILPPQPRPRSGRRTRRKRKSIRTQAYCSGVWSRSVPWRPLPNGTALQLV